MSDQPTTTMTTYKLQYWRYGYRRLFRWLHPDTQIPCGPFWHNRDRAVEWGVSRGLMHVPTVATA